MENEKFPARLHILIAREAKSALVIRRGPAKKVCTFTWNREDDSFQIGQWFKGRIYERRSDISPSGEHWIYFAANHKYHAEAKGSWTAIAKTPWLKAIALFSKGDCWHGGGLFVSDITYWINEGYGHETVFDTTRVVKNHTYQPENYFGGECLNVYYNRLLRDGWIHAAKGKAFEKKLTNSWTLRKICKSSTNQPKGKSVYWDEHELITNSGETFSRPDWEWADWVDNSISYAEHGCLYKMFIESNNNLSEPILLHDFNSYKYEELKAPY